MTRASKPDSARYTTSAGLAALNALNSFTHAVAHVQTLLFLNGKSRSLYLQRKKPANIAWTATYRRAHKKDQAGEATKRKRRNLNSKRPRAIGNLTIEVRAALHRLTMLVPQTQPLYDDVYRQHPRRCRQRLEASSLLGIAACALEGAALWWPSQPWTAPARCRAGDREAQERAARRAREAARARRAVRFLHVAQCCGLKEKILPRCRSTRPLCLLWPSQGAAGRSVTDTLLQLGLVCSIWALATCVAAPRSVGTHRVPTPLARRHLAARV